MYRTPQLGLVILFERDYSLTFIPLSASIPLLVDVRETLLTVTALAGVWSLRLLLIFCFLSRMEKRTHLISLHAIVPGLVEKPLKVVLVKESAVRFRSTHRNAVNANSLGDVIHVSHSFTLTLLSS